MIDACHVSKMSALGPIYALIEASSALKVAVASAAESSLETKSHLEVEQTSADIETPRNSITCIQNCGKHIRSKPYV